MNAKLRARWERAERHLTAALADIELPGTHGPLVADFIAQDELILAFEWLVKELADSELTLTKKALRHLSGAAAELGLRANPNWRRLQLRN